MHIEYSLSCIDVNPFSCLTQYNHKNKFVYMTLGKRLKTAREQARLTQKQLEEKSGVLQQMISKIENGHQDTSAYIVQLAIACNVRPEWLALEQGEMVDLYETMNRQQIQVVKAMQLMPEYKQEDMVKIGNSLTEPNGKESNGKAHNQ